jgi:hypothetical protein
VVLLANGAMSITVLVVYGAIVALSTRTPGWASTLERVFVSPNFHRIHQQGRRTWRTSTWLR